MVNTTDSLSTGLYSDVLVYSTQYDNLSINSSYSTMSTEELVHPTFMYVIISVRFIIGILILGGNV